MDVRRKGFTLFEVSLVVAIVVVVASVSMPFILPMFSAGNLRASADFTQTAFSKAGNKADNEGVPIIFGFKDNKYRIAPEGSEFWEGEAMDEAEEGELPGDIQFNQIAEANNANDNSTDTKQKCGNWNYGFTRFPGGSVSNDFSIALAQKDAPPAFTVKIHAPTGAVSIEGNR